jgi:hypothetical protein
MLPRVGQEGLKLVVEVGREVTGKRPLRQMLVNGSSGGSSGGSNHSKGHREGQTKGHREGQTKGHREGQTIAWLVFPHVCRWPWFGSDAAACPWRACSGALALFEAPRCARAAIALIERVVSVRKRDATAGLAGSLLSRAVGSVSLRSPWGCGPVAGRTKRLRRPPATPRWG